MAARRRPGRRVRGRRRRDVIVFGAGVDFSLPARLISVSASCRPGQRRPARRPLVGRRRWPGRRPRGAWRLVADLCDLGTRLVAHGLCAASAASAWRGPGQRPAARPGCRAGRRASPQWRPVRPVQPPERPWARARGFGLGLAAGGVGGASVAVTRPGSAAVARRRQPPAGPAAWVSRCCRAASGRRPRRLAAARRRRRRGGCSLCQLHDAQGCRTGEVRRGRGSRRLGAACRLLAAACARPGGRRRPGRRAGQSSSVGIWLVMAEAFLFLSRSGEEKE